MWNDNNPVEWNDPSGYCTGVLDCGSQVLGAIARQALGTAGSAVVEGVSAAGGLGVILMAEKPIPTADGSTHRPPGMPSNWVESPTRTGGGSPDPGFRWRDPQNGNNNVRWMPGNRGSQNPAERNPYYKQQWDGRNVDSNGNHVNPGDPAAHIPEQDYKFVPNPQAPPEAASGTKPNTP
jgi:hypothetical protein